MHAYLINLAYILGVEDFRELEPLAPSGQPPRSVEILCLWTSPGGWLPLFRTPRTCGITTASHTWADCVGSKRDNPTGGREENLRLNYSPARRSHRTGGRQDARGGATSPQLPYWVLMHLSSPWEPSVSASREHWFPHRCLSPPPSCPSLLLWEWVKSLEVHSFKSVALSLPFWLIQTESLSLFFLRKKALSIIH